MTAAIYIYLAGVLENIGAFLSIVGAVGLLLAAILVWAGWMTGEKYTIKTWMFAVPLCFLFTASFIPSRNTMYLMAGAVLGEKAVESEIGQQTMQIIKLELGRHLEALKSGTKK